MVVGRPVAVARVESPTSEDIERVHAEYVAALADLYETYNPVYGDESVKLVIT